MGHPISRRALLAASTAAHSRPRLVILLRAPGVATAAGALRLLERHGPPALIALERAGFDDASQDLLRRAFPNLRFVPAPPEDTQFVLFAATIQAAASAQPYGVLAGAFSNIDTDQRAWLSGAQFVFARDSASLRALLAARVTAPVSGFAPDPAFSFDLAAPAPKRKPYLCILGAEGSLPEAAGTWRGDVLYYQPGSPVEAAAFYHGALAVAGSDAGQLVLAAAQGTPFAYAGSAEGVWTDLGLADWCGDAAKALVRIQANPKAARDRIRRALRWARLRQASAIATLRKATGA